VVCLPGMGELRSSYRLMRPALTAAGFRVATMDLRGHGESDATFWRYDDVAAGEDVLALLSYLGEPAVLIGNSTFGQPPRVHIFLSSGALMRFARLPS
jgi:pimeloyl-ACP methyl ester carboxylesterase